MVPDQVEPRGRHPLGDEDMSAGHGETLRLTTPERTGLPNLSGVTSLPAAREGRCGAREGRRPTVSAAREAAPTARLSYRMPLISRPSRVDGRR
jgi:hypothetical protein